MESTDDMRARNEFESIFHEIVSDSSSCNVDVSDIEHCISKLKSNKPSGFDCLSAEHIKYSHPSLVVHLKLLFWLILKFSFVPDDFGKGIIIPILKDPILY